MCCLSSFEIRHPKNKSLALESQQNKALSVILQRDFKSALVGAEQFIALAMRKETILSVLLIRRAETNERRGRVASAHLGRE